MKNLITSIVNNEEGLYDGDLRHYFRLIFGGINGNNPYHNFRHSLSVFCRAYEAIRFYGDAISRDKRRALLIASMFHDNGHSGHTGNDSEEVAKALTSLENALLDEDVYLRPDIFANIMATEVPYRREANTLPERIIRDCDIIQVFSDAWIQQVIFGLAAESGLTPLAMLRLQLDFIPKLKFQTDWAESVYGPLKKEKLEEVRGLLEILDED